MEPLLGNIAFGQDNPYNKMCPLYDGGSLHAVTGCVPVAMAQVMAYYRYPKHFRQIFLAMITERVR